MSSSAFLHSDDSFTYITYSFTWRCFGRLQLRLVGLFKKGRRLEVHERTFS
jgi:hypothetical protein